jgi:N-acyl-phosphatidylethanolamine-hydrolysing phospholipase D
MRIAGLAALAMLLTSCAFARVFGGPFIEMRPVPNKIREPYRKDARLAVLWVGHATVLVQLDDKVVLTDPVFTSAVGQLSRRVVEPGLDVEAVPPLDAVIVSHLHFDHLSLGSLDMLEPKIKRLIVPSTATRYLPDYRFHIHELGWGRQWSDGAMTISSVPVRHNGWRFIWDNAWMQKGFTGYVVKYAGLTVYFGGDSGYGPHFAKTRQHHGPIDLAILPIGPIEPRAIMAPNHVDPSEALDAYRDLGAKWMLAMHFDTFPNSTDSPGDAPRKLREEMQRRGLTDREVLVLSQGEQRVLMTRPPPDLPTSL